ESAPTAPFLPPSPLYFYSFIIHQLSTPCRRTTPRSAAIAHTGRSYNLPEEPRCRVAPAPLSLVCWQVAAGGAVGAAWSWTARGENALRQRNVSARGRRGQRGAPEEEWQNRRLCAMRSPLSSTTATPSRWKGSRI